MRLSWIFWWIVTVCEVAVFTVLAAMLWLRDVDGAGAFQTTELRLVNILILALFFAVPFVIQVAWLVLNILAKRKQATEPEQSPHMPHSAERDGLLSA